MIGFVMTLIMALLFTTLPIAFAVSVNPDSIVVEVTDATAAVEWTTDTASTGLVNYGKTTSASTLQSVASTMGQGTTHNVEITNLDDGQYYYYNIQATDSAGTYTSTYMNFTTLLSAPENLELTEVDENYVELGWDGVSGAQYYNVYKDSALTGVAPQESFETSALRYKTTYTFTVAAVDKYGRESSMSDAVTVTTEEQIVNFTFVQETGITKTTAKISWQTDREVNGTVMYGTNKANLNMSQRDSSASTEHEFTLKDLQEDTTYYYEISGAGTTSDETYYFKTLGDETAVEIMSVEVKDATRSTVEISWITNYETQGEIQYSTDDSFSQTAREDADEVTHSMELEDLLSGITYYFKIVVDDTESDIYNFTTSESLYDFLDLEEVPSLVSDETLLLKGTTAENAKVYIFVNRESNPYAQVAMDIVGTQFEANISLNPYAYVDGVKGRNIVEIHSWDQDNNKALKTYTIDTDLASPGLTINDFSTYLNTNKLNLSGYTEVGATVTFLIDEKSKGSMYVSNESGYFSYQIDVGTATESHNLTIQAKDLAGNTETYTKEIVVDREDPKLEFYTSFTGQTHYKLFRIDGQTEPGASIIVTNFGEFSGCDDVNFQTKYGECDYLANVNGPGPVQTQDMLLDPTSLMTELLGMTIGVPTSTVADEYGNFSVIVSLFPGEVDTQMLGKNTLVFNVTDKAGNVYDTQKQIKYQPSCIDWAIGETTSFPINLYTQDLTAGDITGSALFELNYIGGGIPDVGKIVVKKDDSAGKLIQQGTAELGTSESLYYAQTYGGLENSNEYVTISSQTIKTTEYDKDSDRVYIYVPVTLNKYTDNVDLLPEQFGVYLDVYMTYTDGNDQLANCHLYPAVSYDVQKPESLTKWLSPTMINDTIEMLDQTINITESAVKYLDVAAKWTTIACGASIAWNYLSSFGKEPSDCNENLKTTYSVCDRILCPPIPPDCDEITPKGTYTYGGTQSCAADDADCIKDKYQPVAEKNAQIEATYDAQYQEYKTKMHNKDISFEQYYEEASKSGDPNAQAIKTAGYDDSLSQPYSWQTTDPKTGEVITIEYLNLDDKVGNKVVDDRYSQVVADCGPGTESLIRVTGVDKDESTTLNLGGFGTSVHTIEGVQYICSPDRKENMKAPASNIIPGCYSEKCPYFDDVKCLFGKGYNINPVEDLFGSLQCGCITGAKGHLENLLKILYGAKKCLQQALIGETTAGYCERLMSYFVCDILTQIFKHIFQSLGQGTGVVSGLFSKESLENYQHNSQQINEGLSSRYGKIVNDRMGLSTDSIINKACLAAFTEDWSVLEEVLDNVVDNVEVAPSMMLDATSRPYGFDPFTGRITIAYNLYLGIVPGGETYVKAWLECDPGEAGGEYCAATGSDTIDLVAKNKVDGYLTSDDLFNENILYIDENSASWYNKFVVELTYKIGGELQDPDRKEVTITTKGDILMFGCDFSSDFGISCTLGAEFMDLAEGVGGTVQLYSTTQGTQLTPEVTTYYAGNQIAALVKVANKYPDDFFFRVDNGEDEFEYAEEAGTETDKYGALQWYLLWIDHVEGGSQSTATLADWDEKITIIDSSEELGFIVPDEFERMTLKLYPYESDTIPLEPITCEIITNPTDEANTCIDSNTKLKRQTTEGTGAEVTYDAIQYIKAIEFKSATLTANAEKTKTYTIEMTNGKVEATGKTAITTKYETGTTKKSSGKTTINVLADTNDDERGETKIYSSDAKPKDQAIKFTYAKSSSASSDTLKPIIHFIEPTTIIEEDTGYVNSDGERVPIGFTLWDDKNEINTITISIVGYDEYQCVAKWTYDEDDNTLSLESRTEDIKGKPCGLEEDSQRSIRFEEGKPPFFAFDLYPDDDKIKVNSDAYYSISIVAEDADENQAEPRTRRIKFSDSIDYTHDDLLVCLGSGGCTSGFDDLETETTQDVETLASGYVQQASDDDEEEEEEVG